MGYASTLDYVAAAAAAVLRETGLLPHINAGGVGQHTVPQGLAQRCTAPRWPALCLQAGARSAMPNCSCPLAPCLYRAQA